MTVFPTCSDNLIRQESTSSEIRTEFEQSSENLNLTNRISFIGDRILYQVYSFFNPPPCIPIRKFHYRDSPDEDFDRAIPESYESAKAEIMSLPPESYTTSKCLIFARAHMEEYADPEFRIAQVRQYFTEELEGRAIARNLDKNRLFCTLSLCDEEMHDLYKKEYKQKLRDSTRASWLWWHNMRIAPDIEKNKEIRAEHKETWSEMSLAERAKGICLDGSPSRYLLVAAGTAVWATFFFHNRIGLWR